MSTPLDYAARDISSKSSIFLPLRAVYFRSFQYETPCIFSYRHDEKNILLNLALLQSELFSTFNMTSLFRVFYAIGQIQNFSESFEVRRRFSGYDSMRQIHGTIGSKIMNFRQIKALQSSGMAHRLVNRCVFSILGRLVQTKKSKLPKECYF